MFMSAMASLAILLRARLARSAKRSNFNIPINVPRAYAFSHAFNYEKISSIIDGAKLNNRLVDLFAIPPRDSG